MHDWQGLNLASRISGPVSTTIRLSVMGETQLVLSVANLEVDDGIAFPAELFHEFDFAPAAELCGLPQAKAALGEQLGRYGQAGYRGQFGGRQTGAGQDVVGVCYGYDIFGLRHCAPLDGYQKFRSIFDKSQDFLVVFSSSKYE
jgi:hypothetical protein